MGTVPPSSREPEMPREPTGLLHIGTRTARPASLVQSGPLWLLRVFDSGACVGLTRQVLTGGSFQKAGRRLPEPQP